METLAQSEPEFVTLWVSNVLALIHEPGFGMSKRARSNGTRAMARRQSEGRGQGKGKDYKPWLMIHDVPSLGLATRMKSPLNGRTYHLMSQLEADWLYAFHALPALCDVREQFPLFDLEETLEIASNLCVSHPADPGTKEPCVVTTDFVLNFKNGPNQTEMAIAVKPSAELSSLRILEKLEIERCYWSARNVPWQILTEKELPRAIVKNLRWIYPHIDLVQAGTFTAAEVVRIRSALEHDLESGRQSLVDVTTACDDRLGLKPGAALCVARHLIGIGAWPIDLTVEIDPRKPLFLINTGGRQDAAR